MGIYLNPDNAGFWRAVRSEIYIDKTELIIYTNKYLNTENKYDVIFLNMQQFLIEAEGLKVTEYLEQEVFEELREE